MEHEVVKRFVAESNAIEGLTHEPTYEELFATTKFLERKEINVGDMMDLVYAYQSGAGLRLFPGQDVRVSNHIPPPGGPAIKDELVRILMRVNTNTVHPFTAHCWYENLHPFMDGNGRSGRTLWAWHMTRFQYSPGLDLGFLHAWYYQSLQEPRGQLESSAL
jgi:hypothetical protein